MNIYNLKIKSFAFLLLFVSGVANATITPDFESKFLSVSALGKYYSTNANYTEDGGEYEKLAGDNNLSHLSLDISARYFLKKNLTAFIGTNISHSSSKTGNITRTNSDLNNLNAGTQYLYTTPWMNIIPEAKLTYAFTNVEPTELEVLTSNGAHEVELGAWFTSVVFNVNTFFNLNYTYRTEGLSSLVKWNIGASKNFNTFDLGFSLNGFNSVSDDEDTNSPANKTALTDTVNGGSNYFYSINPNVMRLEVFSSFTVNKSSNLYFAFNKDLNGKSYSAGQTVIVGWSWSMQKTKRPSKEERKVKEFKIEEEDFNEDLFD